MSSGPTVDPTRWPSFNLANKDQMRQFLQNLSSWALNMQNGGVVNGINSKPGSLIGSSILGQGTALGSVSTNQTFDCKGAIVNVVTLTITANVTLTLSHLPYGAIVVIAAASSGGANTLKLAATNTANASYTTITLTYAGGGNAIDMIGTGQSISGGVHVTYVGGSFNGPQINLVGS